jgi:hypothetical protein
MLRFELTKVQDSQEGITLNIRNYPAVIMVFLLFALPLLAQTPQHLPAVLSSTEIPASYFGINISNAKNWPSVPVGTVRMIDTMTFWADLEPQKGQWRFEKLDEDLAVAEKHDTPLVMIFGLSPKWASLRPQETFNGRGGVTAEPKNMEDWRNYIRTMATRYKGRIRYWEVWNEPNGKDFYTGTPEKLAELAKEEYTIFHQIDPDAVIVGPPVVGGGGPAWLDQYFRAGGARYTDVGAFHFYVSPRAPEAMVPLIHEGEAVMSKYGLREKPVWNTETGWTITSHKAQARAYNASFAKILTDDESAAYVARAYVLNWLEGVSKFFWYEWDNANMGLAEADGTPKAGARAFGEIQKWLVGARMEVCDADRAGTWVCQINRSGGYRGYIVWNTEGPKSFPIPGAWRAQAERDLSGGSRAISAGNIQIGITPVLVESKTP